MPSILKHLCPVRQFEKPRTGRVLKAARDTSCLASFEYDPTVACLDVCRLDFGKLLTFQPGKPKEVSGIPVMS